MRDVPRAWPSIALPGYREHVTEYATYSPFAYHELPPIERHLDDELRWLVGEPPVPSSLAEVDEATATPATAAGLKRVAGSGLALPHAFTAMVCADDPRARVRSCTDCYLDLADVAVPVAGGGVLVHFLSDSQWVLHWLVYVGADGAEAVLATEQPLGFGERVRPFDPQSGDAVVCAESFSEFIYRFWIENEIWFRLADPDGERQALTGEQQRYVEHYA